jgi:hypothetical protein
MNKDLHDGGRPGDGARGGCRGGERWRMSRWPEVLGLQEVDGGREGCGVAGVGS